MIKTLKINNQNGAAAVEFALILPLLLLILFGTIEFGLLLYNKQVITNAGREGARAGIVAVTVAEREAGYHITTSESVALNYCSGNLITFGTANAPVVTATSTGINFGDDLTVTVSYDYGFLFLGNIGFNPLTIASTTVMRLE